MYQGKAKNVVPYMERIGVKINKRMNPADFFMLEISDSNKGTLMTKATYHKEKGKNNEIDHFLAKSCLPAK